MSTSQQALLTITDLQVEVEGKKILKGVNLEIKKGEIHALMGPNGSGKSTLSSALMGHPNYQVTSGKILFEGTNILDLSPDERARLGIFLAFQYPVSIPGVSLGNFLLAATKAVRGGEGIKPLAFRKELFKHMEALGIEKDFAKRYVNDGFSGGEKKRCEILQMSMLKPKLAILDETDSGLDIDALRVVSEGVNRLASPDNAILVITHYQRLLNYIQPHHVHILIDGRIAKSGGPELAMELENTGYDELIRLHRNNAVVTP